MSMVQNVRHQGWNWLEHPQKVYVGRFWKPKRIPYGRDTLDLSGYYGNPFHIQEGRNREAALSMYREHLSARIKKDPDFAYRVLCLDNKVLVCWCAPERCHADILHEVSHRLASMCIQNGLQEYLSGRNEYAWDYYFPKDRFLELMGF